MCSTWCRHLESRLPSLGTSVTHSEATWALLFYRGVVKDSELSTRLPLSHQKIQPENSPWQPVVWRMILCLSYELLLLTAEAGSVPGGQWSLSLTCWPENALWTAVQIAVFVVFAHFATLIFQLSFVVRTLPRNHLKFKIRRKKSECDNKTSSGTATNFSGTRQLFHQSTPETSGVSIKVLQCCSDGLRSVSSPWPLKSII